MSVSPNKFAPRRDFREEAAKETDADLSAAIAKLKAARSDPDANWELVGAQLKAYETEHVWRVKHMAERSALKTRIVARRGGAKK